VKHLKGLKKGQTINHKVYGEGIIQSVGMNLFGEVCYDVYFPRYGKTIHVMDGEDIATDTKTETGESFNEMLNRIIQATLKDKATAPSAEPEDKEEEQPLKVKNGEAVDHPAHYNDGKIEVIDFIEDLGLSEGFNLGNAVKYISRAGKKDANKTVEDINKAVWYIERQIKAYETFGICDAWSREKDREYDFYDYIEDKNLSYCTGRAIECICNALNQREDSAIAAENLEIAVRALKGYLANRAA